ncbi:MAG: hypothetical protein HY815_28470 [Candidatus Riflebacteria bacterium]|nr:hypothetical protein [Candidatus Riflebacteria bacterium]
MIVTPASILYGGLGLLGIATGIALLVVALRGLLRGDGSSASAQSSLVAGLVIGQTVLAIRLFSWPCLYWVLKSWVPVTPGAMCIFGVTRSAPHLTGWLQVLEPATLLVAGAMFLVLGAYRAGGAERSARRPRSWRSCCSACPRAPRRSPAAP